MGQTWSRKIVHGLLFIGFGSGAAIAQTPPGGLLTWKGTTGTVEAVTAKGNFTPEALKTVQEWAHWAVPLGYRLLLSDNQRMLLVLSPTYARRAQGKKEDNTVSRFMMVVDRAITEVDRLLPPADPAPLTVPVVLGVRQADYASVVETLGTRSEHLSSWAVTAALGKSGFTLTEPLLAAWIEDPAETEEWSAENELVHRAATLLLLEQAKNLPAWLQVGLAWHVEERVLQSVYCFPYRAGFVSIHDHTDWDRALFQKFKGRRDSPLTIDEIAAWNPRDGFNADQAYLVFGVARYFADHATSSIPPLLKELDAEITTKQRVPTSEHTWTTDPDYRLPHAEQLALLEKHAGADVLSRVTGFFLAGKRFHPQRKR